MNQPPAFQFYVDNFIEGTSEMSPHEVGCYVRLLCHQWSRGQIPHRDMKKIRRVCGGVVSKNVLNKFKEGKNKRLERERHKQQVWREKSRKGGIKGASTRASRVVQPPLQPPLQPQAQPKGNTPVSSLQSPDSIKDDREKALPVELPVGFPKNEAEAKVVAGFVGCTEEFASETWNKAFARGGRDAKDVPIRSWQHYLKSEMNFDKNRTEREKNRPVFRNSRVEKRLTGDEKFA